MRPASLRRGLLLAALLTLIPAAGAHAATFTPADGAELQQALDTADGNGQDDTITLDGATTYTRAGGFAYSAPGGTKLTLVGNGATVTATGTALILMRFDGGTVDISGLKVQVNPAFSYGFAVQYSGTTATLDDIDVSGVTATSGNSFGIYLSAGSVTATNLVSSAVTAQGIFMNGNSVSLTGAKVTGADSRQIQVGGGAPELTDLDVSAPSNPSATGIDVGVSGANAIVRRARISGSNVAAAALFSGKLKLTDSLLLVSSASGRGLVVGDSNNNGTNASSIDARRVTIVGTGTGNQVAAAAGDGGSGEPDQHSITLSDSIVSGIPHALSCSAPAGAATNLITVNTTALPAGYTTSNTCTDNGPGITLNGVTTLAPIFADAAGGDYRPVHTSPLIDFGPTLDPLVGSDLGGGLRYVNGAVDLGAYEYQRAAPAVTAAGTPASPVAGQPVTLWATATDADPGETAQLTYAWTFSDGTTATGASPLHVFQLIGSASATVTVTDPTGLATTSSVPLTVVAPPREPVNGPTGAAAPGPAADRTAPVLGALRVANTIRRGAKLPAAVTRGGQLRFTLSEAATVTARFERVAGKRFVLVPGTIKLKLGAGTRAVRFTGRISKQRRLKPGIYRVVLTATDAARNTGRAVRATFTLR